MLGRRGPGAGGVHQRRAARAGAPRRRGHARRPRRGRARPGVARWLAEEGTFTARKNVELLREFAARPARPDARAADRAALPALARWRSAGPAGSRRSTSAATRSRAADDGALRARPAGRGRRDDRVRARAALGRLPGGAAARRALRRAPLRAPQRARPGARARRRAAPRRLRRGLDQARPDRDPRHQQARRRGDGELPGGGPAGGRAAQPAPNPGREQIDALLAERKPDLVTVEGWRAIDRHELERGRSEQRPRVKLASREELLAAASAGPAAARP